MKRIYLSFRAWLVSLAALLAALPACADVTLDQLEFTEVEGGYSVSAKSGETLEGALVIPDTYNGKPVVEIGEHAFEYCSGLTSINIPDGVTAIRISAFSGCSGLTSITIPNEVTTIEGFAFYDCSGLTSITIPDGVTTIGTSTFCNCSGLTNVHIGDGVTTIGGFAFSGCSGLTNVHIGDGVTTIGHWAFAYCSGLASIVIPDAVTTIGNSAFEGCSDLTEITCCATTSPNLGDDGRAFDDSHYAEATVYVPEEAVEAYRQDKNWSRFRNIAGKNLASVDRIEAESTEGTANATAVYDLRGMKVAASPEGLPQGTYIVRQGGKSKKISVK